MNINEVFSFLKIFFETIQASMGRYIDIYIYIVVIIIINFVFFGPYNVKIGHKWNTKGNPWNLSQVQRPATNAHGQFWGFGGGRQPYITTGIGWWRRLGVNTGGPEGVFA
jgi:hypothetical protein